MNESMLSAEFSQPRRQYDRAGRHLTVAVWFVVPVAMLLFAGALHASPHITGVSASAVSSAGATISWNTDEASDSQVKFGLTAVYGSSTPLDPSLVTSHTVSVTNLSPSTTYHYQVASRDAPGNVSALADFTFITAATQPGIPMSNGTWTMVLTQGLPVESNDWEQLVYASVVKRSTMLSQYHQFETEPNETLLGYNFDMNTWDILDMGGLFHTENMPEGGESQGYFDYNPNNATLMYHCCTSGSNQSENANHTWWYDLLGQSGRDEQTSPEPPFMALQPGGAFDAAHNVFVMEGGASYVGTWTYQPATNTWAPMNPGGMPPDPSLILPAMAYNGNAQKVYLFGGRDGSTYNSNLYAYDVPSNTWSLITLANGVRPPGRYRTNFAYDSTNNIFLLYGGQSASGILGDTWAYDPVANTWTQLNPPQSPPLANVADFARLAYDSDHNTFVLAHKGSGGFFGGNWTALAMQTWLFRYAGTGPNPGTAASTVQPTAGGLNRYLMTWAKDPTVAASAQGIYAAWSETGSPFDLSAATWPHIYANQYSGGAWTSMGSSYQSISSSTINIEAHAPSIAVVAGTPWISWYQSITPSGDQTEIFAANWNGSSWLGTGAIGLVGNNTNQGRSQIIDVGGGPYIAFMEVDKSYAPQAVFAYVKAWNGTSWVLQGGALNRSSGAGSTASSIAIASNGTSPYVAWTEYLRGSNSQGGDTATFPQVHVSYWNGSGWSNLGGSLNFSSSDWAYDASIAFLGGQPYAAWVERTQTGNTLLYVATWNGSSWARVGTGPLNQNAVSGWAFHPILVADNTNHILYLGWGEQTSMGQKAQAFVSKYDGQIWTTLGGPLNADTVKGSAQRISLALTSGEPVVAWSEVNLGSLRNVYVKQWNGSNWIQLPGSEPPDTIAPTVPGNLTATTISANQLNVSWSGSNDSVGVAGYLVYRGGVQVANVSSGRSFQDTALGAYTSYSYSVAAYDAAGNISGRSPSVSATTQPTTPVDIAVLTLSPTSVTGGMSTTANTVTLDGPAPTGGAVVTLETGNSNVATVPPSVTVAAGTSISPAFTVTTADVTSNTNVVISATYHGVNLTSNLSVMTGPVAGISSLNLSPTSVVGGGSTTANTISINAPAPSVGATVTLSSNNSAATPPPSVTVAAGATVSPQFTITTTAVTATQAVTILATYNEVSRNATLTVTPAGSVALSSVSLSPKSVVGGVVVTGNNIVTVTAPAPAGGAVVTLTSSDPSVTVPASVTVAAAATTSQAFTITTRALSSSLSAVISATYNGVTKTASLTVTPPTLLAVALSPTSAVGGASTTNNYVKLNGPAPSGGVLVTLMSSNPQVAAAPASVTVAAGATFSPTFSITTSAVTSNQTVTISGTYNGVSKTATLSVTPVAPSSISLSPALVVGGVSYAANNKVTLNGPAPAGGAAVTLASSDPSVTIPSSVTVAASTTTSPAFAITTTAVSSNLSVTILATYNGVTKTASLTVTTPTLLAVALSPTSAVGGASTTNNYVKLNGPAPSGGVVVTLTSSAPQIATPPASVTVAVGATISPTFTIATTAVTSSATVTISAGYNGTSKSGSLTVKP